MHQNNLAQLSSDIIENIRVTHSHSHCGVGGGKVCSAVGMAMEGGGH